MKRLHILFAVSLLCLGVSSSASVLDVPSAEANMTVMIAGGGAPAAGGACDTVVVSETSASNGDHNVSDTADRYYVGQSYLNLPSAKDICGVEFYLTAVNDISGKTYTAYIYTIDGSGNLDTLLGTSDGVTGSNAWSDTAVKFTFDPAVSVSTANTAFIVSAGGTDATNYAEQEYTNDGSLDGLYKSFNNSGTVVESGGEDVKMVIYE